MKHALFLLLLASPAFADGPTLTLPSVVNGTAGSFIVVKADSNATAIKWVVLDPGLQMFPPDELANKAHAVVTAGKDGTYRLLAYAAGLGIDGKPAATDPVICTIQIGTAPVPPPGPGPGPNPGPVPPVDEFQATLQAAYSADGDTDKAKSVAFLVSIYKAMADVAQDKSIATLSDLNAKLHAAIGAPVVGLGVNAIPKTRAAIKAEENKRLPTNVNQPFDQATRDLCGKEFTRMATLLAGVK